MRWFGSSFCVSVPLLFFSFLFLAFLVVLLCRPSVGPSPGYIIGLIVPAISNLVPSGLGLCPERMHDDFGFVFFSLLFFSFPLCFFPFFALFLPFFV